MENRRIPSVVSAVVLFFVLLFAYTKLFGPIPFSVNSINTNNSDVFQTQGTGKASAVPDRALIEVGVTQTSANVLDAQKKTNDVAEKVINKLKDLGLKDKDIKTTNYSVNPNYGQSGSEVNGYTVSQNIEVKSPIDKANQVVDSATASGANLVGGISYTLDDTKQEELKNEARREAVDKAKKSAEGLAGAAGIKLGRIINITENSGDTPGPILLETNKTAQDTGSTTPTNITPGETNVEVTITLTYQTL